MEIERGLLREVVGNGLRLMHRYGNRRAWPERFCYSLISCMARLLELTELEFGFLHNALPPSNIRREFLNHVIILVVIHSPFQADFAKWSTFFLLCLTIPSSFRSARPL